jgi:hypothetical protein
VRKPLRNIWVAEAYADIFDATAPSAMSFPSARCGTTSPSQAVTASISAYAEAAKLLGAVVDRGAHHHVLVGEAAVGGQPGQPESFVERDPVWFGIREAHASAGDTRRRRRRRSATPT